MEQETPLQQPEKEDPLRTIPVGKLKVIAISITVIVLALIFTAKSCSDQGVNKPISGTRDQVDAKIPVAVVQEGKTNTTTGQVEQKQPVTAPLPPYYEPPPPENQTRGNGYQQTQESPEKVAARESAQKKRDLEEKAASASSVVPMNSPVSSSKNGPREIAEEPKPGIEGSDSTGSREKPKVDAFPYSQSGDWVWLPEHTVVNAVLDSGVDGESPGPIDAHVSMPVFTPDGLLVFPRGTKLLGDVQKVVTFGQQRIMVSFHRALVYPESRHPYSILLDSKTPGMGQDGTPGINGKVNNHFLSTFTAAAAIGALAGLSQIGSAGYSGVGYSPSIGFSNGISSAETENMTRVLDRFLSRAPSIVIKPGQRMIVELIEDLRVPIYDANPITLPFPLGVMTK